MSDPPEHITVTVDGGTLPVIELLTGRGFITGKSGSGKSVTASVIAEELLEHDLSFLIVDTDGEYYGLKEQYEVLHVGADDTCDAKVGVEHAEMLATMALEENVPVVLDVSGYIDESEVHDILERVVRELFVREKTHKKPFLLLVEEAHEYLPQSGGIDGLSERLLQVAKRGRKRGLGICAISQRPAAVDKDYITQCNWLVWHRLTWNNDTDVVSRIIDADAAKAVEKLENGEAILMTDWDEQVRRVKFRMRETVDVGQTPDFSDAAVPDLRPVDSALVERLNAAGTLNADPDEAAAEAESETDEKPESEPEPEPASDADAEADAESESTEPDEADSDGDADAAEDSSNDAGSAGTESSGSQASASSADDTRSNGTSRSRAQSDVAERDNLLLELGDMMVYLFGVLHSRGARATHSLRHRLADVTGSQSGSGTRDPLGEAEPERESNRLLYAALVLLGLAVVALLLL
ncbi:ATP-binding protein [Halorientalis halophila]|uniref:ATP-binding protein n=1 Tax=Halorientalis halophila TaxID=3108499 RepID=UPI00300A996A